MKANRTSNPFLRFLTLGFTAAVVMAFNSQSALATNYYWDTNGATTEGVGTPTPSGAWTTGGTTWSTDSTGAIATGAVTTALTDDLFFSAGTDASGSYTSTITGTQNANSLTFEEGTVTVSGGTINLASGFSNLSFNLATVGSAINITGNPTVGVAYMNGITTSGLITFNNPNTTYTRTGAGSGVVTHSGGITLNSSSGSALTFAGTTAANTVLSGALTFASGANPITVSGTPYTTGNITNNAASGSYVTQTVSNNLVLGADRTFATNTNTGLIVSGNISGSFGLNIYPTSNNVASYITLSGDNSYTGNTKVGYATLRIGSATAIGAGSLTTDNNGHFDNATGNDGLTLANGFSVTGSGGMFFDGTNSMTFGGANTFAAQMTINALSSNSKNLTLAGATTMTGSTLFTVNNSGSMVLGGAVNWGAFQLQKSGTGTLVLSTANSGTGLPTNAIATVVYPSTMRINAGKVSIATTSAFGTGAVDIRGATLLSTADLTGANKLTNTFVNATGSPTIGGSNNIELGGAYILSNGAGSQTLNITNTGTTTLSGTVSMADLTGKTQTLSVNVAGSAGASEISGVIQNTTAGTGTGSFTKAGAGLLKLSGTNTYTGATAISAGTLQLSGSGAIDSTSGITLNGSGAKLLQTSSAASTRPITLTNGTVDGTGTVGAVTVASSFVNTIANGNGTASPLTLGSLTFSGSGATNVTLAGGANTDAPLVVTGALTTSGTASSVSVNATALSPLVEGTTYKLIGYGSFSGNVADFAKGNFAGLSARQLSFQNDTDNKFITFSYSGAPDTVAWTGADDGTWAPGLTGTSKNWNLSTGGTATDFLTADDVVFNDNSGVVNTLVNISANVNPASTTFNHSSLNYAISSPGAFGIAGTGSLVKSGTGSLTLNNANTYVGGTVLNAGTLNLNNAGAIGSGALTISGGTLDNTRPDLAAVTLSSNNTQNWNGNFAFAGTNALSLGTGAVTLGGNTTVTANGAAALTVGGVIGGSSSLSKAGTGTLTLTGINTFTGGTVVNAGTLRLQAGGASGALRGDVTVNAGGTLTLATNNALGYNTGGVSVSSLNVNGGTVAHMSGGDQGYVSNFNLTGATLTSTGGSFKFAAGYGINSLASATTSQINGPVNINGLSMVINTEAGTTSDGIDLGISGVVSGNSLVKNGPGTLRLTGTNTYTGTTTVYNGRLQLGNGTGGSFATTASVSVGANGTLGINLPAAASFSKTIANAGTIDANGSNTNTLSGVISGAGGFTQSGSGTTNLTGANTYTGATTVTGGSLILTSANATGSVTVNGAAAKLTSGVSLNAPVTVTQGTFDGKGTVGAITVASGAGNTVANGNGSSAQLTASSLDLGGAATISLIPTGGATTATAPLVVGALNTSGASDAISINASPITPFTVGQTYNLIQFSSFSGSASEFKAGPGFSSRVIPTFGKTSNFITLTTAGDLPVWTGVNDNVWTTAINGNNAGPNNWATKTAHTGTNFWASDAVELNDTYDLGSGPIPVTVTTLDIQGGVSPSSTTFNNSAVDYVIGSSDSTGIATGSLTKNGTGKVTLTTTNAYSAPTIISAGTLQIGDGVKDGAIDNTASITNNGALVYNLLQAKTVSKVISGTGSVTTTVPTGMALTLGAANSFSGGITVNGGDIKVGNATALGAATNTLTFGANAGTKRLQLLGNSVGLGGINSDSSAIIENGLSGTSVLTINSASDSQFGGLIQNGAGTLALTKTGTEKLTLLNDNTYTGATTVNGGTLQVGNGVSTTGKLGNTAVSVSAGTLSLQTASAISQNSLSITGAGTLVETVDNAISGATTLNVGASLTLTRPNSYTGDTTITADNQTLTVTDPAALGTGRIHTSQATTNYAFHFNGGGNFELPNYLRNFGGSTINFDVNNNGDDSNNGVIKLNGATQLGDSGTTRVNVTGGFGYSLNLANVANQGWHSHTLAFNPTTAPLTIGAFSSVHNGDLNATLRLEGTNASNFIGAITQVAVDTPLTITKVGTGTWTLTGTNSYTGSTNVSEGTLQIGNGGTTGDLPAASAVTDNAALVFKRSDSLTVTNNIAGTGSVTQSGDGTTTLSGTNTYSGETVVNGGVLTIPTAFLSDTAAVRIGASGTLDLTFAGTDTVSEFSIDGVKMAGGTWGSLTSTAAQKTSRITGNGILSTPVANGYASWAQEQGLTAGVNDGPSQDPDFDGISNLLEFVLNGNPLSSDTSKLPQITQDADNFYFEFNRRDDSIAEVTLKMEYGTTLTTWPSFVAIPSDNTPIGGPPVTITDNADGTHHIKVGVAKAGNPKLFGRLNAVK